MYPYEKYRTTIKGRVVYRRKKHYFSIVRLTTIAEDLTKRLSPSDYISELFACHALFEVARTAYEPYWLDSLRPPAADQAGMAYFWEVIEPKLREAWREKTLEICRSIGENMGIPEWVINFVLENLFGIIWDVIWQLTEPLFRGRRK